MVLKPEPLFRAVEHLSADTPPDHVIVMSPGGKTFNQGLAMSLSNCSHLIIICGHYEGIDQRVLDHLTTIELSIGDYVLTGGELPAMVVVDGVTRLLPGALGNQESIQQESFQTGMLEHPQYTRPGNFRGFEVPEILLSGNHQAIEQWRRDKSLEKTRIARPELLDKD
jgi:tRNA (guanine37-N1)-methyltransferase